MAQLVGKYAHEKNENLDEYFKVVGMPYIPRKLVLSTTPSLEIKNDGDEWIITISTLLRTTTVKFKLREEYDEHMPGGVLKSTTTLENDKLITHSIGPNESKISRIYESTETGCIIIYKHEASGIEAKRYFKRA